VAGVVAFGFGCIGHTEYQNEMYSKGVDFYGAGSANDLGQSLRSGPTTVPTLGGRPNPLCLPGFPILTARPLRAKAPASASLRACGS
jgi:hypothetical protein